MEKPKSNNQQEKTKKIISIVLIAIALLALGGLGGYVIGQMNKDKEVASAREEAEKKAKEQHNQTDDKKTERPAHEHAPAKKTTELTCNADELGLSVAPSDEGASAGAMHYEVVLENTGGRICTLGGYPGVSLVNDNGNQIGEPADRVEGAEETTVTLNPGTKVQAAITVPNENNFPAGECKDGATKLRVYPPNDTGYLSAATDISTWCKGFNVAPVVLVQ